MHDKEYATWEDERVFQSGYVVWIYHRDDGAQPLFEVSCSVIHFDRVSENDLLG